MPDRPSAKRESHIRKKQRPSSSAGAVFAVLSLLMLCWMAFALHHDSRTSADWSEAKENTSLVAGLDVFTVNGKSSAFSSVTNRAEVSMILRSYVNNSRKLSDNYYSGQFFCFSDKFPLKNLDYVIII